jgi:hypothetical protein
MKIDTANILQPTYWRWYIKRQHTAILVQLAHWRWYDILTCPTIIKRYFLLCAENYQHFLTCIRSGVKIINRSTSMRPP